MMANIHNNMSMAAAAKRARVDAPAPAPAPAARQDGAARAAPALGAVAGAGAGATPAAAASAAASAAAPRPPPSSAAASAKPPTLPTLPPPGAGLASGTDSPDDMFATAKAPAAAAAAPLSAPPSSSAAPAPAASEAGAQQRLRRAEDMADAEGYFYAVPDAPLSSKYRVRGELGRGVFANVVLVVEDGAAGQAPSQEYAVKVLRANETMQRAGEKEVQILRVIGAHPSVVRLVESFQLGAHLVIVFERMHMNLRETLDRFGRSVGISTAGVRLFTAQLLSALARLREVGVVHADLKPDNVLVSADSRRAVLADFGSAFRLADADAPSGPAPYLVSRFYRAPEIMLGLPSTCAVDVWSLGCVAFELFTGTLPAPGQTNNDMLRLIQTFAGRFPNSMVRRHIQVFTTKLESEPHFDERTLHFKLHEVDPVNPDKIVRRLVHVGSPAPADAIRARLVRHNSGVLDQDVLDLAQVVEACLKLDPDARAAPKDVLALPFYRSLAQA